jgi:hypothetical protein
MEFRVNHLQSVLLHYGYKWLWLTAVGSSGLLWNTAPTRPWAVFHNSSLWGSYELPDVGFSSPKHVGAFWLEITIKCSFWCICWFLWGYKLLLVLLLMTEAYLYDFWRTDSFYSRLHFLAEVLVLPLIFPLNLAQIFFTGFFNMHSNSYKYTQRF